MKKYLFLIFITVLIISNSFAQYNDNKSGNSKIPLKIFSNLKNNRLYAQKHSYDVLNYKLDLNIYNCFKTPFPKLFNAINTITLKVDSTINYIKLDAVNTSLVIDSIILLSGTNLIFNHTSDILTINLNRLYYPGEIVNIKIYYRHNDVVDNAFVVFNGLVFTDCEEERARNWFPCWDKPTDKATTDITVKTPANVMLAGNGSLADSVKTADTIYYHWISRDPMSTYLVAIAGSSDYIVDIRYWHKTSNPVDSIPVRFYHTRYQNLSGIKDTVLKFATYFSSKFGDYPFEKICYADVGFNSGGAMENQTLITLRTDVWTDWFFVPHELAHQWFGDLITCGTWADVWLNEGFATMCELLVEEYFYGVNYYKNRANNYALFYLGDTLRHNIPIYNPPDWYGSIIYEKPACVLYMLRNVIGDSLFFRTLRSYITDTNFIYKNAITSDFTAKLNSVTGQDYNWFINEWILQPGHPNYQNTTEIVNMGSGSWRLNYMIKQVQTNTVFFKMPVEIKVKFTNNTDTTLNFFSNTNNQVFTFDFIKQPDTVIFDPNNKIILKYHPPPQIINTTLNQCSNTLPKPINDLSWTVDTIHVSQQGVIKDVEITLNLNHNYDGDLLIRLENPISGIILSQFNGAGGQNYINTIFDDSATTLISQGTPPFTGRYRPQNPLSVLNTHQLAGDWILRIYDMRAGNQGTLLSWCIKINYQHEVGIKEKNIIVNNYLLFQNYPNPFNPTTNIKYQIPENSFVSLKVYDITGKEVATLVNEFKNAGVYETQFPNNTMTIDQFSSGIYFYKIVSGDYSEVKRMLMIK